MDNPNTELIRQNPERYKEWLNECLSPEDQASNDEGYFELSDSGRRVFHPWSEA